MDRIAFLQGEKRTAAVPTLKGTALNNRVEVKHGCMMYSAVKYSQGECILVCWLLYVGHVSNHLYAFPGRHTSSSSGGGGRGRGKMYQILPLLHPLRARNHPGRGPEKVMGLGQDLRSCKRICSQNTPNTSRSRRLLPNPKWST